MTITEKCKEMVASGRVISFGKRIKVFTSTGQESKSIRYVNGRRYWRILNRPKEWILPYPRLVWLAHGNQMEEGKTIDHIDRNPLNDDIDNLRLATPAEQSRNRRGLKTTWEDRAIIIARFLNKTGTIRDMAREYSLDPTSVRDITRMKYPYNKELLERMR